MTGAPLYTDIADAPDGGRGFYVAAKDSTRIRFALWQGGARGLAVVFPGRSECVEKYGRLAGKLVARGFNVVVIDWRGQGLSDRPDNSTAVGHVESFADYQQDVEAVLSHPAVAAIAGPRVLFAHSMGGCIGLRSLISRKNFSAAVFSAPMWGLNLPGARRFLAPVLASVAVALGMGRKALPAQPKGFYLTREPFEGNDLTHDPEYWGYMRDQILKYPALALGAPSSLWLKQAFREMAALEAAPLPELPVRTFVGGDESVVSPAAIRRLSAHFPNGELLEITGARHEIWMETPEIQAQCWAETDAFLKKNLDGQPV